MGAEWRRLQQRVKLTTIGSQVHSYDALIAALAGWQYGVVARSSATGRRQPSGGFGQARGDRAASTSTRPEPCRPPFVNRAPRMHRPPWDPVHHPRTDA